MGSFQILNIVALVIFVSMASANFAFQFRRSTRCQPLQIKTCQKLGYNKTRDQRDMYRTMPLQELQKYIKLIDNIRCAKEALFFLCTIYSPVCFEGYTPRVLPCRSVCERVKKGCMPYVRVAGYSWPPELDCEKLPEYNTGVCIQPSAIVKGGKADDTIEEGNLTCPKCKKSQQPRRYKQFRKAAYVIEAEIKSRITTAKKDTKLIVYIKKVYKQGKTKISTGFKKILSPTRCVCPQIEFDKNYIIFGREDRRRRKLLFDDRTLIKHTNKHLKRKLQKWKTRFDNRKSRKNKANL